MLLLKKGNRIVVVDGRKHVRAIVLLNRWNTCPSSDQTNFRFDWWYAKAEHSVI